MKLLISAPHTAALVGSTDSTARPDRRCDLVFVSVDGNVRTERRLFVYDDDATVSTTRFTTHEDGALEEEELDDVTYGVELVQALAADGIRVAA